MQIRFIPLVKFIYYKSSKFGGWVHKVGGGGHILKSLRKCLQILCGGKSVGNDNEVFFYWANAITMPELVEINLVSDDDDSLTDRK